ncbi:hypothetical protein ACR780_02040 [Sphingobacterium faecium]|uniref:hypothetical protein n=1 Tax=Sphingobacterium faecium TaxID=34087 RepID=UPI003DA5D75F
MSFELDAQNTESLGLFFKQGTLHKELLKLPKVKEPYTKNWPDQHGVERDTISPVRYEPLRYAPVCYLVADDVEDLQLKRIRILELISNRMGFVLNSTTLGRSFKLYYEDSPSFNLITPILTYAGKIYCEFTLNLVNNFDEVGLKVKLRDVNSLVLTELGQQIYVSINKQLF